MFSPDSPTMKKKKLKNYNQGLEALDNLVAWDFEVHAFTAIHWRINKRLAIWPSTQKYYDIKSHEKGTYTNLEHFVKQHFKLKANPTILKKAREDWKEYYDSIEFIKHL